MKFIPNFDRPPVEVASLEDIRRYMGDDLDGFSGLEIVDDKVIAYIAGQPVSCIGRIIR